MTFPNRMKFGKVVSIILDFKLVAVKRNKQVRKAGGVAYDEKF